MSLTATLVVAGCSAQPAEPQPMSPASFAPPPPVEVVEPAAPERNRSVEKSRRPTRSDDYLTREVKQRVLGNPALDLKEIVIVVDKGFVTLSGTVDSEAEREMAEGAARSVLGVLGVHNALLVR